MIAFFLGLPPCGYSTRFVTCDSDNLAVYRGAAFGGPTRPTESKGHQKKNFKPKGGGGSLIFCVQKVLNQWDKQNEIQ